MKVTHCLGWYYPDSAGGTESYVRELARAQRAQGAQVSILAPRDADSSERYEIDGVPVFRYPVPAERTRAQHEGRVAPDRFQDFAGELERIAPQVFHLHSLTHGAGLHHLRHARASCTTTVTTAHVPGFVCPRGTMMRMGAEPCDGRIDAHQCVPCWLQHRGLPGALVGPMASLVRRLPARLAEAAPGRARTLLTASAHVRGRHDQLLELAALSDHVVAVCDWIGAAMLENGVPADKLVTLRQGVRSLLHDGSRGPLPRAAGGDAGVGADGDADGDAGGAVGADGGVRPGVLRLGYFGRADPIKGLDFLVRAVRSTRRSRSGHPGHPEHPQQAGQAGASLELCIRAMASSEQERTHLAQVRALAAGDTRIRFLQPVGRDDVVQAMRAHDVIVIPSRGLETGPMVALDALAAGIPVLGSALGGIAELIEPGVTGWLEPAGDLLRWSARLEALSAPGAARLEWSPRHPALRTWDELASSTLELYASGGRGAPPPTGGP